jgi:6-phosphogluconolactonase
VPVSVRIEVVQDPGRAASALLLSAVLAGGHVVLTGGSTPRQAYVEVATAVRELGIDMGRTVFWFGDERCVPPDDEKSNYRLAKEALFDRVDGGGAAEVKRIAGELGPFEAADAYERELEIAGRPRFDLVLMGLGPDGHTASLFPDQSTLQERSRLVVGVPEAGLEPFVSRVSLTLPALANSRRMVYLVEGEGKAEAVAAAFGPQADPNPHVPASMVPPLVDDLLVLLDPAAAALLPPQE